MGTIFVTGGTGYIGSHTVLELLRQEHSVVIADNYSNSKPEVLNRLRTLSGKRVAFYEADIRDGKALDQIFTAHPVDCVIHFAGLKSVGESVSKPLEYYRNNLDSTMALCEAMKRHEVGKIVFSSSATVYNGANAMPLTEDSATGGCTNPYGWTKYMCEQILRDFCAAYGGSAVLLRYFNPIGAHESGEIGEDPRDVPNNLMPYITQTAIGRREFLSVYGNDYDTPDGTGVRDYIHVSDLAAGHVAAIEYLDKHTGTEVFNLGTGRGTSVLELVAAFEQASGVTVPYRITDRRQGDLAVCYASTEKAKRELGWLATKTIEDACADSWRWQRNNPNGL